MRSFYYQVLTTSLAAAALTSAPARAEDTDSPYQLNVVYTSELFDNASGGLQRGALDMNNLDAALQVDMGRAFGLTGGTLHLEGFYADRHSFELKKIGSIDTQGAIDTTGPEMWRLYQAYYDQQLGKTDIRFGIYDLETEFSNTQPELLFLSKNFSWTTTFDQSGTMPENGTLGPGNFPYTPLALRVSQQFSDGWSAKVVVANGAADDPRHPANNAVIMNSKYGATAIGEIDYQPTKHTKFMAGVWGNTALLPAYNRFTPSGAPAQVWGEEGGYIGGAARVLHGEGRRGLDAFFTLGVSSPQPTNVEQSFNAGVTYTGLLPARAADKVGLAFNENLAPTSYLHSLSAPKTYDTEDTVELSYRAHVLNDWLALQPDVQYIFHPGYQLPDSLVVGLHIEIGHLFNL